MLSKCTTPALRHCACLLLAAVLLLSLCACGAKPEPALTQPQTDPTTTTAAPTTEATTPAPTETEPASTEPAAFSIEDVEMIATPDSSCFSEVGYSEAFETLVVTFRGSGKTYCYTSFTPADWTAFRAADSLGSYYNKNIKGNFPCEKNEKS